MRKKSGKLQKKSGKYFEAFGVMKHSLRIVYH